MTTSLLEFVLTVFCCSVNSIHYTLQHRYNVVVGSHEHWPRYTWSALHWTWRPHPLAPLQFPPVIMRYYILHVCYIVCSFFSSPEPKAQGELLWSLTVRHRRPSVRPFTIFKQHLLLNHWLDFDQISQEWSLVDTLSKLFKWFRSIAYLGHRS